MQKLSLAFFGLKFVLLFAEPIPRIKWQNISGIQYYFSPKPSHWSKARSHCKDIGGDLAVPTNSDINNQIYQVIKQLGLPTVWIGVYRGDNGSFITVNGVNILYTNWYPGKPNNFNEDCVELMNVALWKADIGAAGRWNDVPCSVSYRYYVCERSATTNRSKGQ